MPWNDGTSRSSPKRDQPVVDPLTVDQMRILLRTCYPDGAGATDRSRALRHVRDDQGLIIIQRGKGGRGRLIPGGPPPPTRSAPSSTAGWGEEQEPHTSR